MGYADHTDSDAKIVRDLIPCLAVLSGAEVLEKHITLDRSKKGPDYYSSLNPDEFKDLVNLLKSLEIVYGSSEDWTLSRAELDYRMQMKKFAVSSLDLKKGKRLDQNDVIFKRTGQDGIMPSEISNLYGRTLNKSLKKDQKISTNDFEDE